MSTSWPGHAAAWCAAPSLIDPQALPGDILDAGDWLAPTGTQHIAEADRDRRLGRLFEQLTADWVTRTPALALTARNLPVRDARRTLGELDMLVTHQAAGAAPLVMHWEITLKFYLGLHADHWPGPDPRDTFQRRLQRLAGHQFPLLHHAETQAMLHARSLPLPARQALFSRGVLFYPHDRPLPPPAGAAPGHLRGTWWPAPDLPVDGRFLPLSKPFWLESDTLSNNPGHWLACPGMIDYVHAMDRPVMVLCQRGTQPHQPGVVVSERWLSDARQYVE